MDNIYWGLVVTVVLMAFFSAMWMAFSASNKLQYELAKKELTERSAMLARIFASPGMFVSAMLAGYILSMVVFIMLLASLAGRLAPSLPAWMSVTVWRFVLLFVIASFVVAVIGKLLPRLLITLNPLVTLRIFSPLLWCFYKILRPVAVAMSALSAFILRIFGVKHAHGATSKAFSRVDLDNFVKSGIDAAENDEHVDEEVKIFSNALDFSEVRARDCCVPRTEIVAIDKDATLDELRTMFVESGISKIIVIDGDIDNVVGYVHSSEMFRCKSSDWSASIQAIPIAPETITINRLLKLLKQEHKSIAVVVDEFGGTSGIITIEDIVEQIFGDIEDEHDTTNYVCRRTARGDYVISARMAVDKVNELLGLSLPESDDYVTVGGLILESYQGFPKVNEEVRIGRFVFKIIKLSARKIELVKLRVE